ncbi:MAG: anthranilate synthase component I family protein [Ferruginibacter sp.]
MKKIGIETTFKKLLADVFTPVGIYLRLRDRFRDTILLESTDFHAGENSYSFIGINAIAGIEISNYEDMEFKLPGRNAEKFMITDPLSMPAEIWKFMERFEVKQTITKPANIAQGLFGYSSYDAVGFFENIKLKNEKDVKNEGVKNPDSKNKDGGNIPLMRYRLYQYVVAIDHFKDELFICENKIEGLDSELDVVESLITSKDVPVYPFKTTGVESSTIEDEDYIAMVEKGIKHCHRGDVFQLVLSRRFRQPFQGDEFNVYRALRSINPSPYLFYFDYGDYKLIGSSPESQLIISNNKAVVHPIAGTVIRTGDDVQDMELAEQLQKDEKENAEHIMLVDLARNDLSRKCRNVEITQFRKINYYSHVIHLVSEVTGQLPASSNPFEILAATFPAGTLSGAPKFRAMQLINENEKASRGYYGGCIGFVGFDGNFNHAIMIRSFLSKLNTLTYQAGAGIVAASVPCNELAEVNNKIQALRSAIKLAETI